MIKAINGGFSDVYKACRSSLFDNGFLVSKIIVNSWKSFGIVSSCTEMVSENFDLDPDSWAG